MRGFDQITEGGVSRFDWRRFFVSGSGSIQPERTSCVLSRELERESRARKFAVLSLQHDLLHEPLHGLLHDFSTTFFTTSARSSARPLPRLQHPVRVRERAKGVQASVKRVVKNIVTKA